MFYLFGLNELTEIYKSSLTVDFDDNSKIVLISDCHRGDGTWADAFLKNRNIYYAALEQYYNKNYTYIEIGDGDELWDNKQLSTVISMHRDVFRLLAIFNKYKRFIMIYGNHDIIKKKFKAEKIFRYYDPSLNECVTMFENMPIYEGIVLKYKKTGDNIFLVHGHQADFLNSRLWELARFLVRHVWRPLELIGINDPTSASKNVSKKASVESKLKAWTLREKHMLIAGHTHRPVFPNPGQPLYFNDGSCVHPDGITAIEITDGNIQLVKWNLKVRTDGVLYAGKETISGPVKLKDYFNTRSLETPVNKSC